ncbi:hypothetical protein PsorP6_001666 [Peronosclerospora sorghi]|uniref:Uncharacterized protein n=1 Tax=Peronosclerospora sorghi TaxID=230839 RepID=A0ACC0WTS8_9STRA|nr:hypothetical protein PsorP6_001666 [Peronosclerospora sorghi]
MADAAPAFPGERGGFGRGGRGVRGRGRAESKEWVPVSKLGRLVNEGKIGSPWKSWWHHDG